MAKSLISIKKTFAQLTDKDSIYYVSPVTQEIEGFKVKEIKGATAEQIKQSPNLRYAVVIEVFHNVLAFQSADIEKIPTKRFLFDGRKRAQMAIVKVAFSKDNQPKLPVVFFADINTAKEWKNQG